MSLILAGLVFAGTGGALFVGKWMRRRRARSIEASSDEDPIKSPEVDTTAAGETEGETEGRDVPAKKRGARKPNAAPAGPFHGFACQLGDVVMRITGEEAWLAGGVVFSEDLPIAILYVAPDAVQDLAIYVRPRPKDALFWLEPLDPKHVLVGGEPPTAVEVGNIRYDRARRLPVHARRIGVGAPDFGDSVVIAEYASAGAERLLVAKASTGRSFAYRGLELDRSAYEVIASGEATLD